MNHEQTEAMAREFLRRPVSMADIANRIGVSRERVRQILFAKGIVAADGFLSRLRKHRQRETRDFKEIMSGIRSEKSLARFWGSVRRGAADDCWPWDRGTMGKGYGMATVPITSDRYAHRIAWRLANSAEIPDGMYVLHSCDNPGCCNPAHLSLGTAADNARDREARGRRGASLTDETTLAILWEYDAAPSGNKRKCNGAVVRIASKYGVSTGTVNKIGKRKTYRARHLDRLRVTAE